MTDVASLHRSTWDAIPWIVNGTASEADRLGAEAHLRCCDACRRELEFQRRIHAAMTLEAESASADDAEAEARASWDRFKGRLEHAHARRTDAVPRHVGGLSWLAARSAFRLAAASAIVALGIGVFAGAAWMRSEIGANRVATATYLTLAASEQRPAAPTVRAVFSPTTTVQQLQATLSAVGLQVAAGPSQAGVWTLGPTAESNLGTEAALRALRANPAVLFAEPVGVER